MTGNTIGTRARTLAVAAAVAVLATSCSVIHVHLGSTASAESGNYRQALAFAQCMRSHGLPGFPLPDPHKTAGVSIHVSVAPNSPAGRANAACRHLLPGGSPATSAATAPTASAPAGAVAADCLASQPACYTPEQLRVAYGIQPLLDRGITGRGQTVVLPEFPPPAAAGPQVPPAATDIRQDLARFDRVFGLPAARLQVVNSLAHEASPWLASLEEVADTEIVHAFAPNAAIREVLIPSAYTVGLGRVNAAAVAALRLSLTQGDVISFSGGTGEQCFTPAQVAQWNAIMQAAQRDRVTVAISASDFGAATTACPPGTGSSRVKGVDLPASEPLALAVGGTTLRASRATGAYLGETAWNTPPSAGGPRAGGGGFSRLFARPAYQAGIAGIGTTRGVPDVAADADPGTGMALAFTEGGHNYLIAGGGNSVATPLWAAIIALADQYAGRPLGFVNPALYEIGRSADYHQAFHDVTTGANTVTFPAQTITGYQAAPGWDPVTGWGSPNAQVLVPLLGGRP
jgi:subtilase family serine protease